MEIRIAGHTIDLFAQVSLNLKFDACASNFTFLTYFDPDNEIHKKIFLPGAFHNCTITHRGVRLLTGNVTGVQFIKAGDPPKTLVQIGGFSKTGVLEKCPVVMEPLQVNGMTLKDIAEAVCGHYGIEVIVDPEVEDDAATVFNTGQPEADEPVRSYLDKMASHLNIVLSHDENGNLLLTRAKAGKVLTKKRTAVSTTPTSFDSALPGAPEDFATEETPVASDRPILYHFDMGTPNTHMGLLFDGQHIHSDIVVLGQYDGQSNDTTPDVLFNPYFLGSEFLENYNLFNRQAYQIQGTIRGKQPCTVIQRQQTDSSLNAAPLTARMVLSKELKAIRLGVTTDRWILDGNMITPNQIISVINPEVYLYKKTEWFIREVILTGVGENETAILECVPVDAFSNDDPENIFR